MRGGPSRKQFYTWFWRTSEMRRVSWILFLLTTKCRGVEQGPGQNRSPKLKAGYSRPSCGQRKPYKYGCSLARRAFCVLSPEH